MAFGIRLKNHLQVSNFFRDLLSLTKVPVKKVRTYKK